MKLVSLELSKAEREKEAEGSCAPAAERPLFPYGTSMYLGDEALKKLGITEMPSVGTVLNITAVAKVTGTSEREYEGGSHSTLDIQFTKMACEEGEEEPAEKQTFDGAAKKLYGGKG